MTGMGMYRKTKLAVAGIFIFSTVLGAVGLYTDVLPGSSSEAHAQVSRLSPPEAEKLARQYADEQFDRIASAATPTSEAHPVGLVGGRPVRAADLTLAQSSLTQLQPGRAVTGADGSTFTSSNLSSGVWSFHFTIAEVEIDKPGAPWDSGALSVDVMFADETGKVLGITVQVLPDKS